MLRLRRSRLFLVLAAFSVIALYHFTNFGSLGDGSLPSIEDWKSSGSKGSGSNSAAESTAVTSNEPPGKGFTTKADPDDSPDTDPSSDRATPSQAPPVPSKEPDDQLDTSPKKKTEPEPQEKEVEEPKDPQNTTSFNGEPPATPAESVLDIAPEVHRDDSFQVIAAPDDGMPKIHWTPLPEHFAIPTKSLIQLPSGKPKAIPTIQFSKFPNESSDQKAEREAKLDKIKKTFAFSWEGYRKNAWMQDELSPVSGNSRNPFCGWAATLVDSLDSLWMLGMKKDFQEAVEAVGNIDFTVSIRNDLPLFEVTIRYLGGLLGAYDISEGKYRVLLDKAVELAEVLMGAFDTPNRMPMTYYLWKPTFASQPHRAKPRVVLAELGSLSLEFTRLAQITKETKYYDAVARITDEFEKWQNNTKIPGLFPKHVDASGCKKPESSYMTPVNHSAQKGPGYYNAQSPQIPKSSKTTGSDKEPDGARGKVAAKREPESEDKLVKRQVSDPEPATESAKPKPDCVAQGLNSPPGSIWEEFTIGGMADSIYEYLPKEYMLLGGLEEKYRTMYEMAADATKKNLIFRPMIEDEERNILVAGDISTSGKSDITTTKDRKLIPEQAHLTCFAGGMFAMGAKLFDRKDDMDVAKRLTDGCVWAYEMTPTGIMPEHFLMTPCQDKEKCPFNETLWYEKLDPYHPRSPTRTSSKQVVLDDSKKESSGQAAATIAKPVVATEESSLEKENTNTTEGSRSLVRKRQLGDIENDKMIQADKERDADEPKPGPEAAETASKKKGKSESEAGDDRPKKDERPAEEEADTSDSKAQSTPTTAEDWSEPIAPVVAAYTPPPIPSQEDYAKTRIKEEKLPKGVTKITGRRYILRPEAVESVFIMYRITGDDYWREKGWNMFTAIQNHTRTEYGASAISDVMSTTPYPLDEMESFWLAETLKYLYLLFSEPDYYSLDDYVFNTEAHPFKRPK